MMKPLLFAPFALLGLASASPPPPPAYGGPGMGAGYPPCSASVTDRCVQTYERHRRGAAEAPPPPAPVAVAAADGYPPCTATRTDRCTQTYERRAAPTRYARWERERVRIGERG
jgi:hypothetical protein